MKSHELLFAAALVLPVLGLSESPPLKLDPKRIINESNGFLKEREPEMSAEEYALYEKVVEMISSQPDFALKLLEGMSNDTRKRSRVRPLNSSSATPTMPPARPRRRNPAIGAR